MTFIDRSNKEKEKEIRKRKHIFSLFDIRELRHLIDMYIFQTNFAEICILCIIVVISNIMVSKPISNDIHRSP